MPQIQIVKEEIVKFFKSKLKYIDLDIKEESVHDIDSWLAVLLDDKKTRYEKALSAKELWKLFTEKSLRKITTNLRGFADLSHYFDDYLEYEDILFALDKEYRDHTIHSIWVMLLGYYLLEKCRIFGDIEFDCVTEFPKEVCKEASKHTVDIIREKYKTPLWFLIALTHDLGYPIQKTQKVNEKTKKMISNFGILSLKELEYNFTIAHHTAIDELLNSLSSQIKYKESESNEFNATYQIGHVSGKRLDYAKSFERLDHGIMSAYLLQLYLDFICDELRILRGVEGECYHNCDKAAKQAVVIDLLNSISAHSCKTRYNPKFNTMESLLLISDELEEFSRYSRESKTHEWREFQCKTQVNYLPFSLYIYFTFGAPDIEYDIEKFFWEKAKKLHGFFELQNSEITELKITCKDITKPTDLYIYEKNSSGARVTYPKISDNWEDYWEWRPTNGSISVSSSPSGADVYLDEEKQGPTRYTFTNVRPRYTIKNVPPGDHTIKLTRTDYQDFSKVVKVTAGHTTVVHANLKSALTPPIISMSKT